MRHRSFSLNILLYNSTKYWLYENSGANYMDIKWNASQHLIYFIWKYNELYVHRIIKIYGFNNLWIVYLLSKYSLIVSILTGISILTFLFAFHYVKYNFTYNVCNVSNCNVSNSAYILQIRKHMQGLSNCPEFSVCDTLRLTRADAFNFMLCCYQVVRVILMKK